MIETIEFKGNHYPAFQAEGYAFQFALPFASKLCKGSFGVDVGCKKAEWSLPGAILVDPEFTPGYDAMHLPPGEFDYICSSHMLEHYIGRFQEVIEYWLTRIKRAGVIFLYLPNCDYQKYWAWGNTKHIHYLNPAIMREFCEQLEGITKYFVTDGYDLNGSFYCIIEK